MQSVGRMLPLFKGDYNADTEYVMLDVVLFKGTSWVAKKRVKNIEPSEINGEYWQILFRIEEATLDQISNSVNEYFSDPSHIAPIKNGGTGANNVEEARANLGFPPDYVTSIQNGGTGANTAEGAIRNLGLSNKADVQIVSYVGTGTYGKNNPCSLTFDFAPKIIKFMAYTYNNTTASNKTTYYQYGIDYYKGDMSVDGLTNVIVCDSLPTEFDGIHRTGLSNAGSWSGCCFGKRSEDGKTISWYGYKASEQCNEEGHTYYFMAIG